MVVRSLARLSCVAVVAALDSGACARLLPKVAACNVVGTGPWLPFVVGGEALGSVRPQDAAALREHGGGVFDVDDSKICLAATLEAATPQRRSEAVAEVAEKLKAAGVVRGWRGELVPVSSAYGAEAAFVVERACYPLLGCKGYGVHVNGFVRQEDGSIKLWVARRSFSKPTWPGLLDHLAAGHQPFGISPRENVIKEAGEEAGVPPDVAAQAKAVGAVSYRGVDEDGRLKNDCLFVYDLELPEDFEPVVVDGEVDSFLLCGVDGVLEAIAEDAFKPNCVLVLADFFIRHGILSPEMPKFLQLVASLRQGDCA
ncbi:NUDIX hydrolase domain-like protein [Pelagophyceae sp. CCMP2097]|nr:NUDIX hydrolase domain-like protein [Pelagophyceae sp. CCMP2097]|mmetsp:Transcript_5491/g.17364  ORF Transcript_5491/g.17364 Transcript_5491/m.17364 type:complete len:313 (+) Transcript_5491:63-1001(+)